jgi:hypothetical protein
LLSNEEKIIISTMKDIHTYSIVYGCALSYYLKSLFLKFIVKHILETKVAMVHSSFPTLYLKYKEI